MRVHEVFVHHKKMGNNLFAAIAAVDIASMKSSWWERTSWLDSACGIMPEWREAADIADRTANFEPIYDLIRQALRDAGRKTREVWDVEETLNDQRRIQS